MNIYETVVILSQNLGEEDLRAATDKIAELVAASGGEILKTDVWGKRKLSYELNKQRFGIYVFFLFRAPAATVKRLEEYFKVFDPLLKFMVIRLSKKQIESIPKEILGIPVTPQEIQAASRPDQTTD